MKNNLIVTDNSFEDEVLKSKIPVLVDFWASWCIPSQMMIPLLEKLSNEYDGKAKIRKINVDHNPRIRDTYKILGCPTFILFMEGIERERKVGSQSEEQLCKMIDSIVY